MAGTATAASCDNDRSRYLILKRAVASSSSGKDESRLCRSSSSITDICLCEAVTDLLILLVSQLTIRFVLFLNSLSIFAFINAKAAELSPIKAKKSSIIELFLIYISVLPLRCVVRASTPISESERKNFSQQFVGENSRRYCFAGSDILPAAKNNPLKNAASEVDHLSL